MFFRTSTGGLVIIGAALPKNGYEYLEFKKHRVFVVKVKYNCQEQISFFKIEYTRHAQLPPEKRTRFLPSPLQDQVQTRTSCLTVRNHSRSACKVHFYTYFPSSNSVLIFYRLKKNPSSTPKGYIYGNLSLNRQRDESNSDELWMKQRLTQTYLSLST